MKKKIYTIILNWFYLNSFSQTIYKNDMEPHIGDNYIKHIIDNPSALNPGSGGLSQTWDLSNASFTLQNDYLYQIVNPSATPHTVTSATFVIKNYPVVGNPVTGYAYYKDTTNGYQILKEFDDNFTFDYFSAEFIYKFPLTYGDSVVSNYTYSSTAFSITYNYTVKSKLKLDGVGTLYCGSSPVTNVFRLVYTNESIRQSPNDTSYTIKYMWYMAGTHHPLAEYIAYLDPNGITYYAANMYSLTNTTGLNEINEENSISVYPNPANESVKINSSETIEGINITDVTGKIIYHKQNINCKQFSLETKAFVDGIYFLQLIHNKNISTQKLIIKT